ncbi:hypothetical protein PVAND_000340 [Polypedilum vanderplanki]|uniref:Uncharacterized protein n=1 Tax=Polypedilum vanderplanki TaxID=319348 RepID=A0A9J6BL05_POLVA|nr:hypothetical protein PVAND_000340 [Polypedilum vanderplanki]
MSILNDNKLCPSRNLSNSSSLTNNTNIDYECNIILQDESICLDAVECKKRASKDAWKSHIQRIDNLARPRKRLDRSFCDYCFEKEMRPKKVPLEKLLPRINILSQPRRITPKYVKPPPEKFPTKKIQDWQAHEKWLVLRAKPREFIPPNNCSTCPNPKRLSRNGWRRISELSQPKIRKSSIPKSHSMKCKKVCFMPLRVCELSKPKIRMLSQMNDNNRLKVSASALSYRASERIKQLALPKYYNIESMEKFDGSENNYCCCRSFSFDDLYYRN